MLKMKNIKLLKEDIEVETECRNIINKTNNYILGDSYIKTNLINCQRLIKFGWEDQDYIFSSYFIDYKSDKYSLIYNPFIIGTYDESLEPFGEIMYMCFGLNDDMSIDTLLLDIEDRCWEYVSSTFNTMLDAFYNDDEIGFEYFDDNFYSDFYYFIVPILKEYFKIIYIPINNELIFSERECKK